MSEPSAIWMFLSICAICFTWYRIATFPRKELPTPASEMRFLFNGQPVDGSAEITTHGKTHRYKIIDGWLQ